MKVLLVLPYDPHHGNFTVIPHLGLGFLATMLRRHGYQPIYFDAIKEKTSLRRFAEYLIKVKPDVVALSVFSPGLRIAGCYAELAKQQLPNVTVVAGGPHPTFRPVQTLHELPSVDFALAGEGEFSLPALLEQIRHNLLDFTLIPGVAFRENGGVRHTPAEVIGDLAAIGQPAWDLMHPDTYPLMPNGIFSRRDRVFPLNVTRGCPFRCVFCGAQQAMGARVRQRPLSLVLDEIGIVARDFGLREFHIMDDNFTAHQQYLLDFCDAVANFRPRLDWACPNGVRLDTLNESCVRAMYKSGCYSTAVGIETGDENVLQWIDKHLSLTEIREKLTMIRRVSKMRVSGMFIVGLPIETEVTVRKTISFACSLPLARANFFNFTPFPGSRLSAQLEKEGKISTNSYSNMFIHKVTYAPPAITIKRLAWLTFLAHWHFYARARIIFGLLRELHRFSQLRVIVKRIYRIGTEVFRT